jgi:hypothetical protein
MWASSPAEARHGPANYLTLVATHVVGSERDGWGIYWQIILAAMHLRAIHRR